jgi:hypothetical protein
MLVEVVGDTDGFGVIVGVGGPDAANADTTNHAPAATTTTMRAPSRAKGVRALLAVLGGLMCPPPGRP